MNNKLLLLASLLSISVTTNTYADCCSYGWGGSEASTYHKLKFIKNDQYAGLSISKAVYVDDEKAETSIIEAKFGAETRKSTYYWLWGVYGGSSIESLSAPHNFNMNYFGGMEFGIGIRSHKLNLGTTLKAGFDSVSYNGEKNDGVALGLGLELGYNFTDNFYLGVSTFKNKNFTATGLTTRINF